ncbi:MAG: hypothetical protein A2X49_06750 [Lentisphaerae bacterium GWF2_52_8]|nr:MAG: hypothetical protein A2X49_06750 [Lentisphaerae bacterium GWF2_52_8]
MKVALTGKHLEDIKPFLQKHGFSICEKDPELLITHGGDGTLLGAERLFPGLPKLPLRDVRTAPLCPNHHTESILELLNEGKLPLSRIAKLEGVCGSRKISGINDVFIHNAKRVSAVRYRVWIDDELYAKEVVGDGVGVATILGSTAYYRSITHGIFRVGIGLAFSNSTEVTNHLVLPETSVIKFRIIRGPSIMVADNAAEDAIALEEGDMASVSVSSSYALVYGIDAFMCPECRQLRLRRSHPFDEGSP